MFIIYTVLFFLIANILVWYQLHSQLVWDWAKTTKSMWVMSILGVPISIMFWYATKFGYDGFSSLWKVRLLAFSVSMLVFPFMTWLYLGEVITFKIAVSILLAIIIMILQLL